jgi:hypothetical protein
MVGNVVIRMKGYVAACGVLACACAAALTMAAIDSDEPYYAIASFLLFASALRSAFLRVELRSDEVIVHAWIRTTIIPHEQVGCFDTVMYSGVLNKSSDSNQIGMLSFIAEDGGRRDFSSVAGRWSRVRAVAKSLNAGRDAQGARQSGPSESSL